MAQPDLENMTKEELLRLAEKNRIPVRRSLLKKEIVSALKRGLKKSAKASTRKTRVPPKTGKPPARVKATSRKARPAASGKKTAASKAKPRKSAEPKKVPRQKPAAATKPKVKKASGLRTQTRAKTGIPTRPRAAQARKAPVRKQAPAVRAERKKEPQPVSPDTLHPPFELEDMAREAKFIVGGPGLGDEARTEGAPELPRGYGDNTLVLMPRDPYWAYVYWEIQPSKLEQGLESLNRRRQEVRPVLRLHSVPEVMGRPFDVDVDLDTGYHYMQLSPPGSTFYAELGLRDPEGRFLVLLHSNEATMPLDGPSEVADEEWMTSETEFQEMYALSGGFAPYLSGSEALGQRFRVSQDVSAWSPGAAVSSWSAGISSGASHPPATLKKGQNMALEAELVLYGTARPGATVKVNDRAVDLRPDGTFTTRVALPEGQHSMNVSVETAQGVEKHVLTPVLKRKKQK